MKILKIVLPIVVVIVFIGSAITLGRLHSNSPASANSSQKIKIDSDDASLYSSNSNGSPVTSWVPRDDGSYPSTGVAISEDSPTGCRKAIMRGVIERYNLLQRETVADRQDPKFGRVSVHNDGNVKATSLAKRLNIPYEEVVVDLWNVRMDTFKGWSEDPKLRYAFEGIDIPSVSANGTVFRFLGIDNSNCTLHFEQFEWNADRYKMMWPIDFVEYGTHLKQFVS